MQKDAQNHAHQEARSTSVTPGFQPARPITRYELAATLASLIANIDQAAAQPRRSKHEVVPGRKKNLTPNPSKAKNYSDVPASHWAKKSLISLNARGIALLKTSKFEGEKTVTGDELAIWLDEMAGWVEGRPATVRSAQALSDAGYIPQTSPLVKKRTQGITAAETAQALVLIISRAQEKVTTVSPDSRFAK